MISTQHCLPSASDAKQGTGCLNIDHAEPTATVSLDSNNRSPLPVMPYVFLSVMSVANSRNHTAYASTITTVMKHREPTVPRAQKYLMSPGYGHMVAAARSLPDLHNPRTVNNQVQIRQSVLHRNFHCDHSVLLPVVLNRCFMPSSQHIQCLHSISNDSRCFAALLVLLALAPFRTFAA